LFGVVVLLYIPPLTLLTYQGAP